MDKEKLMERRNELDEKRNRIEKIKAFLIAMLIIAILLHAFWWPVHIDVNVQIPQPIHLNKIEVTVEDDCNNKNNKVDGVAVKIANDSAGNDVWLTGTTGDTGKGKVKWENVPYGIYFVNISFQYDGIWYYNATAWTEVDLTTGNDWEKTLVLEDLCLEK